MSNDILNKQDETIAIALLQQEIKNLSDKIDKIQEIIENLAVQFSSEYSERNRYYLKKEEQGLLCPFKPEIFKLNFWVKMYHTATVVLAGISGAMASYIYFK